MKSLSTALVLTLILSIIGCGGESDRTVGDEGNGVSNPPLPEPPPPEPGRFTVFSSDLDDLVANDDNGFRDVFVHDRVTGQTTLVSVACDGKPSNGISFDPTMSADGRFVAFSSTASNLVKIDTNNLIDVFVRDLQTSETARISVDSSGAEGTSHSREPAISADGRFVVFTSFAWNLVADDTNRDIGDIFVYDQQLRRTTLISAATEGIAANESSWKPAISADGRFVAFASYASNLVANDTNRNIGDIFVYDQQLRQTTLISEATEGMAANETSWEPAISADGRFVAFASNASNLVEGPSNTARHVFVTDRQTGRTERVSVDSNGWVANSDSDAPSISADGRFVAFSSYASNLVEDDHNNDLDVFVHDRQTGQTTRVSVAGNAGSYYPRISADGRFVTFTSDASNLVEGDTNDLTDVFVHDLQTGTTTRVSVGSNGAQGIKMVER